MIMVVLGCVVYLVVAVFFFLFACAMNHDSDVTGPVMLGLIWPLFVLFILLAMPAWRFRDWFVQRAMTDEVRQLRERIAELEREVDGFLGIDDCRRPKPHDGPCNGWMTAECHRFPNV